MTLKTHATKSARDSQSIAPPHPQQFRLPKPREVDPWFGGNRSFWNEQILPTPRNDWTPSVRSRVIRKPGAKKALRFIVFSSAAEFFRKLDATTAHEMAEIRAQHMAAGGGDDSHQEEAA